MPVLDIEAAILEDEDTMKAFCMDCPREDCEAERIDEPECRRRGIWLEIAKSLKVTQEEIEAILAQARERRSAA